MPNQPKDYDEASVLAVLRSQQIPAGPKGLGEVKAHEGKISACHFYYYATRDFDPFVFIKDQIDYFLSTQQVINRRVAFLFKDPQNKLCACIVQLDEVDNFQLSHIRRLLNPLELDSTENADTILEHPDRVGLADIFKELYKKIQFLWLGEVASAGLQERLYPALSRAYSGKINIECMTLPDNYRNCVLTECVLDMLFFGKAENKKQNILQIMQDHKSIFISDFMKALSKIAENDVEPDLESDSDGDELDESELQNLKNLQCVYKIQLCLIVLSKYKQLMLQLNANPMKEDASVEELEKQVERIQLIKKAVYQQDIVLEDNLKLFSLKTLIKLCDLVKNPENLLTALNAKKETALKKMDEWEKSLRTKIEAHLFFWPEKLKYRSKKALKFLYQNSLVDVGGGLLEWCMGHCCRRVNRTVSNGMQNAVKRCTKRLARSKETQKKWDKQVQTWISMEQFWYLTGAGIGVYFSLGFTSYNLVRHYLIAMVAHKLYSRLQHYSIDDPNALILDHFDQIKPLHTAYIAQVLVLSFEYHYFRDVKLLLTALGGLNGGVGVVHLAIKVCPSLERPVTKELAKDAAYIKFLFHLGGSCISYSLTESFISNLQFILTKRMHRNSFLEYLEELDRLDMIKDVQVNMPNLMSSLELWTTDKNPVFVGWRYSRGNVLLNTHCQVQEAPRLGGFIQTEAICDRPTVSRPLLASH